jgi:hypothetical protein
MQSYNPKPKCRRFRAYQYHTNGSVSQPTTLLSDFTVFSRMEKCSSRDTKLSLNSCSQLLSTSKHLSQTVSGIWEKTAGSFLLELWYRRQSVSFLSDVVSNKYHPLPTPSISTVSHISPVRRLLGIQLFHRNSIRSLFWVWRVYYQDLVQYSWQDLEPFSCYRL